MKIIDAAMGTDVAYPDTHAGAPVLNPRPVVFSSVIHPVLSGLINHAAKAS